MYYVYIIENTSGKHYIGVTADLGQRLTKHNQHGSRWTKHKGPWCLRYKEDCGDKQKALLRERKIKSYKGGEAFRRLIEKHEERVSPARTTR